MNDYSIVIDQATGVAAYPWQPVTTYSPPAAWNITLVKRMDPANLSQWLPRNWCNRDVTLIPPLVPPPPQSWESEVSDLYRLVPLRRQHGNDQLIADEAWASAYYFIDQLRQLLIGAGADLKQLLSNGKTARDHIDEAGALVFADAECVVLNQKALFNRSRPYQLAAGLCPVMMPGHPAYPSGHSTQLHALAWIMKAGLSSTRYGSAAALFNDYATAAARRREIAGVHYASDTVGGMALANRIVETYLASADFKAQYIAPLLAMK